MPAQDIARDSQPKTRAAGFAIAAGFQPAEGGENRLKLRLRNAGAFIGDGQAYQASAILRQHKTRRATIIQCIRDQVGDSSFQRQWPGANDQLFRTNIADLFGLIGMRVTRLISHRAAQGGDIHLGRGFCRGIIAGDGECRADHRLHLIQISQHFAPLFIIIHEFGAQFQPRDRGAQIMANRGQHLRTIRHKKPDACGHFIEGAGSGHNLGRAVFG